MKSVENGSFPNISKTDSNYPKFYNYRGGLYVYGGVILYKDRVLILPSLHPEVLYSIHAARQGETAMLLTVQSTTFWPGMTKNIIATRGTSQPCIKNAPSQAIPSKVPKTPFECVVADYFDFKSMHYLAAADRLSGKSESYCIRPQSGNRGLLTLLKQFFFTFSS